MKHFNVRDADLKRNLYFLEASAGTGKTFSIEHLVRRYLVELEPQVTIDQILVLTFTKASARELSTRIYHCLYRSLRENPSSLSQERLIDALHGFDDAQIGTIHRFCMQMLRQYDMEKLQGREELIGEEELRSVVRDFFRSGLIEERYSLGQLQRLRNQNRGDMSLVVECIVREIKRGIPICTGPSIQQLRDSFAALLPRESGANLAVEFEGLARHFKEITNRQGQLKEEPRAALTAYCEMLDEGVTPERFDQLILHGLPLLYPLKKGRSVDRPLPTHLDGILSASREPVEILARMARDCQMLLQQLRRTSDRMTHSGMLEAMQQALMQKDFVERVRARYRVVIVDEFQDTDPVQWEIFKTLFQGTGKPFVLVGDPKQSIYAFRNADVYCYLAARSAFGEESCYSLGVNYRSRPGLVQALNGLFSDENAPGLFHLPRQHERITYNPVSAGVAEESDLSRQAVHFLTGATQGELYLFLVSEMVQLQRPFSEYAVLVRDRYQAADVVRVLTEWGVPAVTTRGGELAESEAFCDLRKVIRFVYGFKSRSTLKRALATRLLGGSEETLRRSSSLGLHASSQGFAPFYEQLLRSGVLERLLREEGGVAYFRELERVAAYLIDNSSSIEELLTLLDHPPRVELPPSEENAVQVLTAFASKGLEYGIVFALALGQEGGGRRLELVRFDRHLAAHPVSEELHREEGCAEKIRLLYVAMTRARERVYVPLPSKEDNSPVGLLLSRLKAPLESIAGVCVRDLQTEGVRPSRPPAMPCKALIEPTPLVLPTAQVKVLSFTQLATPHGESSAAEEALIPSGAETGRLIHAILEKVPYSKAPAPEELLSFLAGTHLESFCAAVAEMLGQTFQLELRPGLRLADVDERRMHRELEFLYPEGDLYTGVIDLLFEHEGAVYLLDWKTNHLPAYDPQTLQEAMERQDYLLQAKLYGEAARRYLSLFGRALEGIFYVFLRGPGVYLCQ